MGQQKALIYAFVGRGNVILAEYTDFSGNFNSIAYQCLQKLPASNNKFTYNCDGHTFNYLVDNGFTYCVVAEESVGRQIPIAFLERIKDDFMSKYGSGKAATAPPNSLNKEFGPKLKEHMQYCAEHPEEISKLAKVKAQVSEVKGVMMENIEKVLDRGEKIELLVDKTENLHHQAQDFRNTGTQIRRKMWLQNMKIKLIVLVGNIPYDATEEQLMQICEEVGPVVSFRLVIDKETGKPKGYGFCEYKDEETALSARRNLKGYEINGRQLRVDFAENDKNSDRNREQGRGGPGMTANVDPQKHIGGPAVPVDSALQQPLGMSVAMTAAAVMAGALGAAQSSCSFSQSGIDPLTLHMSKLSRSQLKDVMSEFKAMCTQNKEQTRQLLLAIPNLSKALFLAQLILGMVTQPMLQTPNIQQSAAPKLQPLVLDSQQSQQLSTQSLLGLPPLPPSLLPQAQPQTQLAQSQNQVLQSQLPMPSRNPSINATQVNVSINPTVQVGTSVAVKQQMQPFFLQQAGPVASMNFTYNSQLGTEKTRYPPPPSSMRTPSLEQGSQGNPSVVSGVLDNTNKDSQRPQAPNNSSLITRPAYPSGLPEVKRGAAYNLDLLSRPSKTTRLNDGISYALPDASVSTPQSGCSTQILAAAEMSNPDKQATQVQLPSDVESALLQQVLSLTPEQLSALPPDQQQQVIQLQQMLRRPT